MFITSLYKKTYLLEQAIWTMYTIFMHSVIFGIEPQRGTRPRYIWNVGNNTSENRGKIADREKEDRNKWDGGK